MKKFLCLLILPFLAATSLCAQRIDYNDIYRFPLSVSFEYQNLSSFTDYGFAPTAYYDLSLSARLPLPVLPSLQPFLKAGMITLVPPAVFQEWAHVHWYLMPGLAYIHRFSKTLEVGAEVAVGASEAVFPELDPDEPRGSPTLLAEVGARVALDPSFNFSLDVHPRVLFQLALTPLTRFNGASLGIGFSASYRFGQDPDAPQAVVRSIRFGTLELPPVYPAMQSWYADTPDSLGAVTVTNTEAFDLASVEISFFQNGYMDSPTKLASIPVLEAGASVEVGVKALYNAKVFETDGVIPLTGELVAEYVSRGRPFRQSMPLSYQLLDRHSISWSDDAKVGAFITPQDSALRNLMSFLATEVAPDVAAPGIAPTLQTAMQVYGMLKALRCVYVPDPTTPFTAVQGRTEVVDSVSLARETLKLRTGDCDDLTVLFCSLLEAVSIPTAYLLVPGHIYAAFNTGVAAASWQDVHPEKRMTFAMDGSLWVPVEVTLLEKSDFLGAWRRGVEEWETAAGSLDDRRFVKTAAAQKIFRPVGLQQTDLGLQYGNPQTVAAAADAARTSAERLVTAIVDAYGQSARTGGTKREYNRFGLACAKFGRYDQAEQAFAMALSLDRSYLTALLNWGNVMVLKQQLAEALRIYHEGEEALSAPGADGAGLLPLFLMNLSRCYYELEDYERSRQYFERATTADPGLADRYAYLKTAAGGGRQAAAAPKEDLLFAGEEE
ncbi:MAG: tetratricopeptide repeat protein [Spirochaetes bacterium]|nr:tetratricopeptide repeat protein [Spirochaetota bacterium]